MSNLAYNLAPADQAAPAFRDMANAIRALSMDAVEKANSGHPGMPMGMADVATVLFTKFLKYDAADPHWPDRDRFVLSAGHGSMLIYSLLYLTGVEEVTLDQLRNFRQLGSITAGHPEYGYAPGIETTTGPLGQGLANAVGMAIAERLMNARYGDAVCDHYTYVLAGDGCLMEGISQEAIDLAGHLKLHKLIVLFDDNSISIDGATDLSTSIDQLKRFEASGWAVARINGHDPAQIESAIAKARTSNRPSLIACRTLIGYGAPNKQGTAATHGSPLGADEIKAARSHLGWPHAPFELPEDILAKWRAAGARGQAARHKWDEAVKALPEEQQSTYLEALAGSVPQDVTSAIHMQKKKWLQEKPKLATRKSSEASLQVINDTTDLTIGGSADLTHSNYTITKGMKPVKPDDYTGRYIHYGIREHGMAAAMNGIALHGGFIPYGGTFLIFSDYCRPSIRLSALMHQRVIYVMTHDSIGLGEDGPTHQPVEQLASLRALPNCLVFRPADAVETLEAWECALAATDRPSVLCLSRQNLPALRSEETEAALFARYAPGKTPLHEEGHKVSQDHGSDAGALHKHLTGEWIASLPPDNLVARGAYVLREADGSRTVTFLATGSEVSLAVEAADRLSAEGVYAAVVSMPSFELFRQQPQAYRKAVLGEAPRVAIEAAVKTGWHEWLGDNGAFIGMESFGASGPYLDVYRHFGITVDAAVGAVKALINQ